LLLEDDAWLIHIRIIELIHTDRHFFMSQIRIGASEKEQTVELVIETRSRFVGSTQKAEAAREAKV
jgi:hypothetical protein